MANWMSGGQKPGAVLSVTAAAVLDTRWLSRDSREGRRGANAFTYRKAWPPSLSAESPADTYLVRTGGDSQEFSFWTLGVFGLCPSIPY
jgi:hypothetical protein